MKVVYALVSVASIAATLVVLLVGLAPDERANATFDELRADVARGDVAEVRVDGRAYAWRARGAQKRAEGPEPDVALVLALASKDGARPKVTFAR